MPQQVSECDTVYDCGIKVFSRALNVPQTKSNFWPRRMLKNSRNLQFIVYFHNFLMYTGQMSATIEKIDIIIQITYKNRRFYDQYSQF